MNKLFLIIFLFWIVLVSCGTKVEKLKIPEPLLKTDIKVSIYRITPISTNTNLNLSQKLGFLKNLKDNINILDFDGIEEIESITNTTNFITNTATNAPDTNTNFNLTNLSEVSTNIVSTNVLSDKTNLILPTTDNKFDADYTLNLDSVIRNNLRSSLKSFIRSLTKYNYEPSEIRVLNTPQIEGELLKLYTNEIISNSIFTNYITNIIFETNYYRSQTNTNKIDVEILETELVISELKISNDTLMNILTTNYPWVLKITNGVKFDEGTPSDYSISVFYDIYEKPVSKYLTNLYVGIFVLLSNNLNSNYVLFKTNLDLVDLLSSDYRIFSSLKPFFYNYRTGLLKVEVEPKDFDIFVDDFYVGRGETIPEYFSEGIHKITLSRGYFVVNEYVMLEKNKLNIYKRDFTKKYENISSLNINTIPVGADIFVENTYIGKTPTNINLPTGNYRIWLKKDALEKFLAFELNGDTNITVTLEDLNQKTGYNVMTGITIMFGVATASSIFLYFFADSQEKYYDFLVRRENKEEYVRMREYYYYFKDNMRTTAIVGAVATFVLWGVTLGLESDKFFIKWNFNF
ncbi:MAG: PEGA domain-containing protein [Spirochaetia bacterium]|nr:PEGA domain-containing protein [Spirochaetota bacterium]MDW8111726.1 PEGA domain-containing protein [Spirochaetia bacterium]